MSTASDRFEIRCTPHVRELVEVVRSIEGDVTYSQLFRRLVTQRARDLLKTTLTNRERAQITSLLEDSEDS